MSWTRAAVLSEVRSVIQEHTEPDRPVHDAMELVADLGLDSLAVMEIVADLEDRFGMRITEAELVDVVTLADVGRAIAARLARDGRLETDIASGEGE